MTLLPLFSSQLLWHRHILSLFLNPFSSYCSKTYCSHISADCATLPVKSQPDVNENIFRFTVQPCYIWQLRSFLMENWAGPYTICCMNWTLTKWPLYYCIICLVCRLYICVDCGKMSPLPTEMLKWIQNTASILFVWQHLQLESVQWSQGTGMAPLTWLTAVLLPGAEWI